MLDRCVIVLLLLATLAGCAEGYTPARARVAIVDVSPQGFPSVAARLRDTLTREGFSLGTYQGVGGQRLTLERETHYVNEKHHLDVVISNFTGGVPSEADLGYVPPSNHFIELDISDDRPGGFSTYGLGFYDGLLSELKQRYGTSVRVINSPPPADDAEYRRITRRNTGAAVLGWIVTVTLSLLVIGSLSGYLLAGIHMSPAMKRIIFVAGNTWLVTPLPFPIATILSIPAPNLFAFPWTSVGFYADVASYASVSFPLTLLACFAISVFLFRNGLESEQAGQTGS